MQRRKWLDDVITRLRTKQSLFVEDEPIPHSRRLLLRRLLTHAFHLCHGSCLGNGSHTLVLGPRGVGKSKVLTAVVAELHHAAQGTPLVVWRVDLKASGQTSPVDIILEALGVDAHASFGAAGVTTAAEHAAFAIEVLRECGKRVFLVIEEVHKYWELGATWKLESAFLALQELYCLSESNTRLVNLTISGSVAVLRELAFRTADSECIDPKYRRVFNAFTSSLNRTRFQTVTLLGPRQPYPFARLLCAAVTWWPQLSLDLQDFATEHGMEPLDLTSDDLGSMQADGEVLPPIVTAAFVASGGNLRLLSECGASSSTEVSGWLSATATMDEVARAVLEAISDVQAANHAGAAGATASDSWSSWEYMELVAASDVLRESGACVKDLYRMSDQGKLTLVVNTHSQLLVGFARPWDALVPQAESEHFGFHDMLALLIPRGGVDEWWTAQSLVAAPSETTGFPASALDWNSRELPHLPLVSRAVFSRLSRFATKAGVDMKPAALIGKLDGLTVKKKTGGSVAKAAEAWLSGADITYVPRQVHRAMKAHINTLSAAITASRVAVAIGTTEKPRWLKETPNEHGGALVLVDAGEHKEDGHKATVHRVQVKLGGSKCERARSPSRDSAAAVKTGLDAGDKCVSTIVALALGVSECEVKTKHYLVTTREFPATSEVDGLKVWSRAEMAPLWHHHVSNWAERVRDERYTNA